MLGVAVRIARRMGIHNESSLSKCTPLEAEMRRRLWWSIVLFDARISELAAAKTLTLDPTWDCKTPLNVSDSDLRPEMTDLATTGERPTEAIYAVVHSELGDFIRHSDFYLEFTEPALKPLATQSWTSTGVEDDIVAKLNDKIENQYLKACDQKNPIHFMTIWTARMYVARYRFLQNLYRISKSPVPPTAAERDAAAANAIRMLECDSKVMTCPLTKGFLWMQHFRFPFPAYFQLCQYLRRQSTVSENTHQAWEVMSDNHEAWFGPIEGNSPFFSIFAKVVMQAWDAHESAVIGAGGIPIPPRLVNSVRHTLAQAAVNEEEPLRDKIMGMGIDDRQAPVTLPTPAQVVFPIPQTPYQFGMGMPGGFGMAPEMFPPTITGNYGNQMDWSGMGNWQNW
jgi:Fungal specific transcription factor domain